MNFDSKLKLCAPKPVTAPSAKPFSDMKNLFYLVTAIAMFAGCTKNKPKIGDYKAWFYGSYTKNGQTYTYDRYRELSIIDVNDAEIKIAPCATCEANTILQKDKKTVSGIIIIPGAGGTGGPSYPSQEINITGTWEKQKGKYSISGFHQWIYTEVDVQNQTINEYIVSGEFEVKSK